MGTQGREIWNGGGKSETSILTYVKWLTCSKNKLYRIRRGTCNVFRKRSRCFVARCGAISEIVLP
eukprot:scaffold8902_cov131-Amphora_coffeaeformis.AAC.3